MYGGACAIRPVLASYWHGTMACGAGSHCAYHPLPVRKRAKTRVAALMRRARCIIRSRFYAYRNWRAMTRSGCVLRGPGGLLPAWLPGRFARQGGGGGGGGGGGEGQAGGGFLSPPLMDVCACSAGWSPVSNWLPCPSCAHGVVSAAKLVVAGDRAGSVHAWSVKPATTDSDVTREALPALTLAVHALEAAFFWARGLSVCARGCFALCWCRGPRQRSLLVLPPWVGNCVCSRAGVARPVRCLPHPSHGHQRGLHGAGCVQLGWASVCRQR